MFHKYYKINENSKEIIIVLYSNYSNYKGICTLRIYEKDKVGISVEQWKTTDKCELMVISAHRDDEVIFFGGTIPYYSAVKKKKICTVFMSGCDIIRIREAHESQWSMGINNYPIFMCFPGGFHDGINGTINDWGGEEKVLGKIVENIRNYKPDVIVTHDFKGERGHPTHKTVAYLVQKAVKIVSDKNKFIDTYKLYGTHEVKKIYMVK
jgi:LmbE family N-acetylglucosaminyl deacetylase